MTEKHISPITDQKKLQLERTAQLLKQQNLLQNKAQTVLSELDLVRRLSLADT